MHFPVLPLICQLRHRIMNTYQMCLYSDCAVFFLSFKPFGKPATLTCVHHIRMVFWIITIIFSFSWFFPPSSVCDEKVVFTFHRWLIVFVRGWRVGFFNFGSDRVRVLEKIIGSGRVWVWVRVLVSYIESIGYYRVLKFLIGYFPILSYLTLWVLG